MEDDLVLDGVAAARVCRVLSRHGRQQMHARRLSIRAIEAALGFGRVVHTRGAAIHTLGRREVDRLARRRLDLRPYEGVQVVCAPDGGVLTAYRNRDFRRLRPRRRRGREHSLPTPDSPAR